MKKKGVIVSIIIMIMLILILLTLLIYAIINKDFKFDYKKYGNMEIIKDEKIEILDVDEIDLYFQSSDIEVIFTNDEEIKIVEYGKGESKEEIETYRVGNTIKIIDPRQSTFSFFYFVSSRRKFEVYIPNTYSGNLRFEGASSDFSMIGSSNLKEVFIKTISGEIKTENIISSKVTLKSTSGDINVLDILSEEALLSSTSGDISVKSAEKIILATKSGDVIINEIKSSGEINTISGEIDIVEMNVIENSKIESVSGDINIKVLNGGECEIKEKTVSGTVNIKNGLRSNGISILNLKTISGDITVD